MSKELRKSFREEAKAVRKARAERLEEAKKDQNPLFNLPEGVTTIRFLTKPLREANTRWGLRKVFTIEVKGKVHDLMVNPNVDIYGQILDTLADADKDYADIQLVRVGQKQKTRYSILEPEAS